MRILVAGGSGFIGTHFIMHILKIYPDYQIINLDLKPDRNLKSIKKKNKNYTFMEADVQDPKITPSLIKKVDAVVNLCGETEDYISKQKERVFIERNFLTTYSLLEAAKTAHLRIFLQASTAKVYVSNLEEKNIESDPFFTTSIYAATKASAELLCQAYLSKYNLPIVIARASSNFGPYQSPKKLFPFFILSALNKKRIPLYNNGLNVQGWLYVLEHVRALDFLLHQGRIGQAYNIAGENELSDLELARLIIKELGQKEDGIEYLDTAKEGLTNRLDANKLYNLGFRPLYDFSSSLKATVDWYKLNNPDKRS